MDRPDQRAVLLFRKCRGEAGQSVCWSIVYLLCEGSHSGWVASCLSRRKADITEMKSLCHVSDSWYKHTQTHINVLCVQIPSYNHSETFSRSEYASLQSLELNTACMLQQLQATLWCCDHKGWGLMWCSSLHGWGCFKWLQFGKTPNNKKEQNWHLGLHPNHWNVLPLTWGSCLCPNFKFSTLKLSLVYF